MYKVLVRSVMSAIILGIIPISIAGKKSDFLPLRRIARTTAYTDLVPLIRRAQQDQRQHNERLQQARMEQITEDLARTQITSPALQPTNLNITMHNALAQNNNEQTINDEQIIDIEFGI